MPYYVRACKQLTVLQLQLEKYVLDDHGANPNCVTKSSQEFILGRDEAIYFYGADGRGACLAFAERKLQLIAFNDFLLVLSTSAKSLALEDASLQLNIYDLKNRLIAHTMSLVRTHLL